jgi:hypothetical protein
MSNGGSLLISTASNSASATHRQRPGIAPVIVVGVHRERLGAGLDPALLQTMSACCSA